jgi:hypothetical protein
LRRFIQVLTLLVMVLAGSWPAAYLGGAPRPMSCCGGMTDPDCPCRMPSRSSGPTAPCGMGQSAPVALLAAPGGAVRSVRVARSEPRPVPAGFLAPAPADRAKGDPSLLARPGPWRPAGPDDKRQAKLSVFRI